MKKSVSILVIVFMMALLFTMTVYATQPEYVTGYVPLLSVIDGPEYFEYDVCDPYLEGHVVQPAAPPGFAIHGTFTSGDSDYCEGITELEGTCEITLIPVEDFMDPETKKGRAVLGRCTGDLQGYHARFVIHQFYEYDAWYHIDP